MLVMCISSTSDIKNKNVLQVMTALNDLDDIQKMKGILFPQRNGQGAF